MTITQIADTAGCSRDTVKRLVRTMFPDLRSKRRGLALELNKDQAISVMDKLPKKNYVDLPSANAPMDLVQNNHVDYDALGKMIAMAVSAAMVPLINEMKTLKQGGPLQLEHIPELPTRVLFRKRVDELVQLSKVDHSTAYNKIYSEMGYVYGIKIKARAKNANIKPIEVLERDMYMGKAIAITDQFIETVKRSKK